MDFISRAKQLTRQRRYKFLRRLRSRRPERRPKQTAAGFDLFAEIIHGTYSNKFRRVINLMSHDPHHVAWLGEVAKHPRARAYLETCCIHDLMGGDFYDHVMGPRPARRLITAKRAMRKRVKDGDIIAAYNDGSLTDILRAWRDKRRKPVKFFFI